MAPRSFVVELPAVVESSLETAEKRLRVPETLERLLGVESAESDWSAFVNEYSLLILHATRSVSASHDEAMDGYAQVLEEFRKDGYRRLRGYARDPRSRFTTWIVVVSRRVCVDVHRAKYGRKPATDSDRSNSRRRVRRQLEDLVGSEADLAQIADRSQSADDRLGEEHLRTTVASLVRQLPAEDQLLLRLRFDDGLSASEIAHACGMRSQFQVYRRLNSLMSQLRGALAQQGVEGPSG